MVDAVARQRRERGIQLEAGALGRLRRLRLVVLLLVGEDVDVQRERDLQARLTGRRARFGTLLGTFVGRHRIAVVGARLRQVGDLFGLYPQPLFDEPVHARHQPIVGQHRRVERGGLEHARQALDDRLRAPPGGAARDGDERPPATEPLVAGTAPGRCLLDQRLRRSGEVRPQQVQMIRRLGRVDRLERGERPLELVRLDAALRALADDQHQQELDCHLARRALVVAAEQHPSGLSRGLLPPGEPLPLQHVPLTLDGALDGFEAAVELADQRRHQRVRQRREQHPHRRRAVQLGPRGGAAPREGPGEVTLQLTESGRRSPRPRGTRRRRGWRTAAPSPRPWGAPSRRRPSRRRPSRRWVSRRHPSDLAGVAADGVAADAVFEPGVFVVALRIATTATNTATRTFFPSIDPAS